MYDLDELQAKHLKDILKIKAEAVKNSALETRSKEVENTLMEKIAQLQEDLEEARATIKKLKEDMKLKEREFSNQMLDFKRRQTIVMQQRDKMMRRPMEMMESSESETTEEEIKPPKKSKKDLKDVLKQKKKVARNDLLNLPSSEDEKVVKKLKNLHEPSSFEQDKSSDNSAQSKSLLKVQKGSSSKQKRRTSLKKDKSRLQKRVRTNSFDQRDTDRLEEDGSLDLSKRRGSKAKLQETSLAKPDPEKEKILENPEETKKKLEDAEYKDLQKRYNQDERDLNFVLNNQDAIHEAKIQKAKQANNELNESIDKIEEEQDRVFRERVGTITLELIEDLKRLNAATDIEEIERLREQMIKKVFASFLDNKQELLKKIANKLASAQDLDDYDEGYDNDEYSPKLLKANRRSELSSVSSRQIGKKNKANMEDDTDMDDSKSSHQINDFDETPHMIDRSSGSEENEFGFDEGIKRHRKNEKHKSSSKKRKPDHPVSKESESQTTFLMNIQTTADLISYVKSKHVKRPGGAKRSEDPNRRVHQTYSQNRLNKPNISGINHMRHFGLMSQGNARSIECQTDDLDILDLRVSEVNLTEVYHFDKVSSCLKKIVIEKGVDAEILRQFEYIHKDSLRNKYQSRQSIVGRYSKNISKQDLFKKNIGEGVAKGEIHRYNDAIKALINKVKDYEHEHAYLEEKRSCISSEFPLFKESEDDVFNRGWRKGYSAGYNRGNSMGFFKGSIESQYIGHQKGIEEGMQEGWNFGFDEGFKTGIRKVFRDARDAGIDLSSLELMEYISQEDKIKGLMKNLYTKLTKVFATSDRLEASNKLHEKF